MVSHGLYLQIIMISFICSKCIQSNFKAFHILHTYRVGAQRKGDYYYLNCFTHLGITSFDANNLQQFM